MLEKSGVSSGHQFMMSHIANILQSGETWRYFIDGPDQLYGRLQYEEKGYLRVLMSCLTGLQAFDKERLTVTDLNELHRRSVEDVIGTSYDPGKVGATSGAHRCRPVGSYIAFGLYPGNSSKAGYVDLINQIREGSFVGEIAVQHSASDEFMRVGRDYFLSKTAADIDSLVDQYLGSSHAVLLVTASASTDIEVAENLQRLLDYYYTEIEAASNEVEKLTAIARFCQDAARQHPYFDGNGRMFCMLVPYLLCMQQGLVMPMLSDVNVFANCSIEEMVAALQQGMEKTKNLLSGKPFMPALLAEQYVRHPDEQEQYECHTKRCLDSLALSHYQRMLLAVLTDDTAGMLDLKKHYVGLSISAKKHLFRFIEKHYAVRCYEIIAEEKNARLQLLYNAVWDDCADLEKLVSDVYKHHTEADALAVLIQAQYEAACHGSLLFLDALKGCCQQLDFLVDARIANQQTALHGAMRNNQQEMVTYLIGKGADPHASVGVFTAFHYAFYHKNTALVLQMMHANAVNKDANPLGHSICMDLGYMQQLAVYALYEDGALALTESLLRILKTQYPHKEIVDCLIDNVSDSMQMPGALPCIKKWLILFQMLTRGMKDGDKSALITRRLPFGRQLELLTLCLTVKDSGLTSADIQLLFRAILFDPYSTFEYQVKQEFLAKLPTAAGLEEPHRAALIAEGKRYCVPAVAVDGLPVPLDPRFFSRLGFSVPVAEATEDGERLKRKPILPSH